MYERFTDRARKVMFLANQAARLRPEQAVGVLDLIHGILEEGKGVAYNVLKNLGANVAGMRIRTRETADSANALPPDPPKKLPLTPAVGSVISRALVEAKDLGHNYVGTEHLLLGMIHVNPEVLDLLGLQLTGDKSLYQAVRDEILGLLGQPGGGRTRETSNSERAETASEREARHDAEAEKVEKSLADRLKEARERWEALGEKAHRTMVNIPTATYQKQPSFADLVVKFAEARSVSCPAESPEAVVAYAVDLARKVSKAITPEVWTCTVEVPVAVENSGGEPVSCSVEVTTLQPGEPKE